MVAEASEPSALFLPGAEQMGLDQSPQKTGIKKEWWAGSAPPQAPVDSAPYQDHIPPYLLAVWV